MADAKKSTARRSPAKKNSSSRNKAAQKNQNDKVLWSIVFFAAAVLVFAFSAVRGESAWLSVHNFILGMFGKAVYILPVIMIYTSFMIAGDKSGEHIKGKIIQGIILTLILCGMLRIFSNMNFPAEMTLMRRLAENYESGKELVGGGLMSIFIGETLLGIFGRTGAGIIVIILAAAWICLLFNKTVFDIFAAVKNFFAAAINAREDYEEPEEVTPVRRKKKTADNGEFKAPPGAAKKKQKTSETADEEEEIHKNRENFNVDISIPAADPKKSKKDKQKEKTAEEADIIARTIAANESAKAAAKAAAAVQKQKADDAKDDMKNASGELDDIIRKAALSGRTARQAKEAAETPKLFGKAPSPAAEDEETAAEKADGIPDTPVPSVPDAPAVPVQTVPVPVQAAQRSAPAVQTTREPLRKPAAFQKSSTLASNKITDDEDLDLQAMTAKDIQNEINAEEKAVFEYHFPPIELLRESHNDINAENAEAEMKTNADILVNTLKSFGVMTRIVDIHRGPTVTRYELQPSAGVKISKITSLADDIALNLAAEGVRIEAPIPGKAAVGIEVPNRVKDTVTMRDVISSEEFKNAKSKLTFAVGKNIDGEIVLGDISKLPHVIIAGTTGSGKSVCTNGIIMSILYNATPDEVRLVLVDPKVVEFKIYDGIPHLLIPVVTDPRKAAGALAWAVQEMLKRYKLFADRNVRDINGYNEKAQETEDMDPLPRIVIVIDELADLMMAAAGEVEDSICRLAQMARAAGMHLIIATQRPTVDVITGLIKANIPSRIALTVSSQVDSRTIIDTAGAEKLLGYGDMLYYPQGIPKPVRVQGCFVSTKEVEAVVSFIKSGGTVEYSSEIIEEIEKATPAAKSEGKGDNSSDVPMGDGSDEELIDRAVDVLCDAGQASVSFIQRKLKLGYARAARIMDQLEELGVVGPYEGSKPRAVIITKEMWLRRKLINEDVISDSSVEIESGVDE